MEILIGQVCLLLLGTFFLGHGRLLVSSLRFGHKDVYCGGGGLRSTKQHTRVNRQQLYAVASRSEELVFTWGLRAAWHVAWHSKHTKRPNPCGSEESRLQAAKQSNILSGGEQGIREGYPYMTYSLVPYYLPVSLALRLGALLLPLARLQGLSCFFFRPLPPIPLHLK